MSQIIGSMTNALKWKSVPNESPSPGVRSLFSSVPHITLTNCPRPAPHKYNPHPRPIALGLR
jgi:hypothetical protein